MNVAKKLKGVYSLFVIKKATQKNVIPKKYMKHLSNIKKAGFKK